MYRWVGLSWVFFGRICAIYNKILIVCVGNICRSPTAQIILQQKLPSRAISSAGIEALVGHDLDNNAASILVAKGYGSQKHTARQLNRNLVNEADLVLVMEKSHQALIMQKYPDASGKIILFGRWQENVDITDPYRKGSEVFNYVFDQIEKSSLDWAAKLTA